MTAPAGRADLQNVLMIVPAFPPANTSATARAMHFAKNLPDFGYWPLVLVQTGLWTYREDPDLFEDVNGRCDMFPTGPATDWPVRILGRPLAWCVNAVRAGMTLHRTRTIDLIWATSPSILHWYAATVLSWIIRRPLVLDVRDPVTYGCQWHPRGFWDAAARRFAERICMRSARRIVHASPLTMQVMGEKAGPRLAKRMVTVPNGFSSERPPAIRDLDPGTCVFLHTGKLERLVREPGILFEGFRLACRDAQFAQSACLEMAGGLGDFADEVGRLNLQDRVRDLGYLPQRECLARMAGADVLVLLQTISGEGSDVIAGKVYDYLASRKPILAVVADEGGDAWLLRETGNGLITGIASPQAVADGFLHLWQLSQRGGLGSGVSRGDIARFDRRNLTRELADVFNQVLAGPSPRTRARVVDARPPTGSPGL